MINRTTDTQPTTQTWSNGERWTVEVNHGRAVTGYAEGHRRLIEALNLELGHCTPDQCNQLGVHRVAPTNTRLRTVHSEFYEYTPPRANGVSVTLEAGKAKTSFARAKILCAILRDDQVHPMRLRERGVDTTEGSDWPCGGVRLEGKH